MEKNVGSKRKFSFDKNPYEIIEIINNPEINMDWTWETGTHKCPYCNRTFKSNTTTNHKFHKIEILGICNFFGKKGEENNINFYKLKENLTKKDILIMGYSLDGKYLSIPKEKNAYNQALSLSDKYKKFLLEE